MNMKKKMEILKRLILFKKNINNQTLKNLCNYFIKVYVLECILKRKSEFKLIFSGKYIESFTKRMKKIFLYIFKSIYIFLFSNNNHLKIYDHCLLKPIFIKLPNTPDEIFLYYFMEKTGFKILDEDLYSIKTVYTVKLL